MVKLGKKDPFMTSKQIKNKMPNDYNVNASARTVRRCLNEFSLCGCIAIKEPLVSQKNRKKRFQFAEDHCNKPIGFWKKCNGVMS